MWTPDGTKINFTINLDAEFTDAHVAVASAAYTALKAAGLLPREPGLEDGEQSEPIACIVRREHYKDGKATPVLDLYSDSPQYRLHRFMVYYLNTPDDIAAFEAASGLVLAQMPLYDSEAPLERDKNPNKDAQYTRRPMHPLTVVYKINPAAKTETDGKRPKLRLFVRWQGGQATELSIVPRSGEQSRQQLGNGENRQAVKPLKDWLDWEAVFKAVEVWIEGKDYPARKAHFWNLVKLMASENTLTENMGHVVSVDAIIANRKAKAVVEL